MNLRQLEAFRATYMVGSVSRAAETIHVSQPSVSRLIGDLEASVGFLLFERTPRGLKPTPEAKRLFDAVEQSYIGIQQIKSVADAIRDLASGEVSFGMIPSFVQSPVPEAIARMHADHKDVRIHARIRRARKLMDEVETGRLDLALVSPHKEHPNVDTLFEASTQYVCVMPATHPAANQSGPLDLMELDAQDFIGFDPKYLEIFGDTHGLFEALERRTKLSSHSAPMVSALAEITGSPALLDPFTAAVLVEKGNMISRPIQQDLPYDFSLIARRDAPKAALKLGEYVRDALVSDRSVSRRLTPK